MITFKTLSDTSSKEILDCFNLSFSDYALPFQLSLQQLETKFGIEDINKDISVGAFHDDELIGFVLHGGRILDTKRVAYNAGTGVVPTERGSGLTTRMYQFILPTLRSMGFDKVVLEVLSENIPAIKSYQRIGFLPRRKLDCFKGEIISGQINKEIRVVEGSTQDLADLSAIGEIEPTWQNSMESIRNLGKTARQLFAYSGDEFLGYCILNSTNNRILQIAVKKDIRNSRVGSTLLNYIEHNISKECSIINVDTNYEGPTNFFIRKNMLKSISQDEMELMIDSHNQF